MTGSQVVALAQCVESGVEKNLKSHLCIFWSLTSRITQYLWETQAPVHINHNATENLKVSSPCLTFSDFLSGSLLDKLDFLSDFYQTQDKELKIKSTPSDPQFSLQTCCACRPFHWGTSCCCASTSCLKRKCIKLRAHDTVSLFRWKCRAL